MVEGVEIPVQTKLFFRGVAIASGACCSERVLLCLSFLRTRFDAPGYNELPEEFPAAGAGWRASATAARYRGRAEREGPRYRHSLHRGEVGSLFTSDGLLGPAFQAGAGGAEERDETRPRGCREQSACCASSGRLCYSAVPSPGAFLSPFSRWNFSRFVLFTRLSPGDLERAMPLIHGHG